MDIQKNQIQESVEKLYVKNAPAWSLERDQDGGYKYHATQSAFLLFEQQQVEIDLLKNELAKAQVPEGFVLLPVEPTQAIKTALSYQCFDFIKVAQIYRDHGFDIPKKAENEQSFFLHKFLLLAIKHGDDFIKFFNAETKAMIEAREQSHD